MKLKPKRVEIINEIDIADAVNETKIMAEAIGFKKNVQFMISTATSELARNIFTYALHGEITINPLSRKTKKGIAIVATDEGPGIKDIGQAMQDGFSTNGTMGLGLPGTKRLMDEFVIDAERKVGTKITVRKWV